jgi:hypothetical protein
MAVFIINPRTSVIAAGVPTALVMGVSVVPAYCSNCETRAGGMGDWMLVVSWVPAGTADGGADL